MRPRALAVLRKICTKPPLQWLYNCQKANGLEFGMLCKLGDFGGVWLMSRGENMALSAEIGSGTLEDNEKRGEAAEGLSGDGAKR